MVINFFQVKKILYCIIGFVLIGLSYHAYADFPTLCVIPAKRFPTRITMTNEHQLGNGVRWADDHVHLMVPITAKNNETLIEFEGTYNDQAVPLVGCFDSTTFLFESIESMELNNMQRYGDGSFSTRIPGLSMMVSSTGFNHGGTWHQVPIMDYVKINNDFGALPRYLWLRYAKWKVEFKKRGHLFTSDAEIPSQTVGDGLFVADSGDFSSFNEHHRFLTVKLQRPFKIQMYGCTYRKMSNINVNFPTIPAFKFSYVGDTEESQQVDLPELSCEQGTDVYFSLQPVNGIDDLYSGVLKNAGSARGFGVQLLLKWGVQETLKPVVFKKQMLIKRNADGIYKPYLTASLIKTSEHTRAGTIQTAVQYTYNFQ